jgi:hypothetical protein
MIWQQVRKALLASVVVAAGTASARGDDCCAPACAPATRTVTCIEYVPEQYQTTRTTYKTECRQEAYTAYRCEMVPETRTRTVTCYKTVSETVMETRTVCVKVPVTEQRTVMKTCTKMVPCQETVMVKVDRGHWECKQVEVHHPLRGLCHRNDCCPPCPEYKTKKCWVPCVVCEPKTVCRMKCVTECVPTTVCVTTCKIEQRTETCPVTRCRCVPECRTETYTCCVAKQVPFQCTRTVKVCVPCTETVTCCRMVPKCVEKQVACGGCGESCGNTCCGHVASYHKHAMRGHKHGHDCGTSSCCDSGCGCH